MEFYTRSRTGNRVLAGTWREVMALGEAIKSVIEHLDTSNVAEVHVFDDDGDAAFVLRAEDA